jgi:L-2-hydroxyglutarate oxidase LhgO
LQPILADAANHHDSTNASSSFSSSFQQVMNATVTDGRYDNAMLQVQVDHELWLHCNTVVNCAGLHAPTIANLFEQDRDRHHDPAQRPRRRHYFCKGNYFRLVWNCGSNATSPGPFSRLIYPVPDQPGGLGIHATMDLHGAIRFGPDVEWIDPATTCPDEIDLRPSMDRVHHFYDAIRQYWPALPDGCLEPDYAGIRPKLQHPDVPSSSSSSSSSFQDFLVEGPATHGIKSLINLLGMESPGLTSCFAIAEYCTALDGMTKDYRSSS